MLGSTGLLLCLAAPVASQVDGRVDLGLGGSSLPSLGMSSLWAVAPAIRWQPAHFRLEGSGEYRDFGAAGRSVTGAASASWFMTVARPVMLEVNGAAEGREGAGRPGAGTWDGGARLHLLGPAMGGWLGLRGGQDRLGPLNRWEAALWRNMGRISLQLQGRRTAGGEPGGAVLPGPTDTLPRVDSTSQTRVRITTDLGGWLSWDGGRLQLRGGLGWRLGRPEPGNSGDLATRIPAAPSTSYNWWMAEGTWWLSERVGFTGAVGTQPPNPSLEVASGSFMRLSIRVALNHHDSRPLPESRPSTAGLEARRTGRLVEFSLDASLATKVELMGDFTDWQPVEMSPQAAGRWRIRLPVEPGVHYLNVRYDGGNWQPPPQAHVVRDEFGKESGVLLID